MYTKIDETKAKIEAANCVFFIDATEQNFEACGIPADEEMIAEEKDRASIHARLLQDFEDEGKLNVFIALLQDNPSTAYTSYLTTQKIR